MTNWFAGIVPPAQPFQLVGKRRDEAVEQQSLVGLTSWRRYAIAGYALIFVTFGVMGSWAAVVRLDRAVISPGVIIAESSRKVVQHFEGGMVLEVLVKEGQSVQEATSSCASILSSPVRAQTCSEPSLTPP